MDRYSISGFGTPDCGKINTSLRRKLGKRVGVTKGRYLSLRKSMFNPHPLETARKLAVVLGEVWNTTGGLGMESSSGRPNVHEEEAALREFIRRSFPETLTTDLCGCVFGCREQRPEQPLLYNL